MRPRVLALVDGEHYPPVVRAALEQAGIDADVVAALLLGGTEKLNGDPEFGVLVLSDPETALQEYAPTEDELDDFRVLSAHRAEAKEVWAEIRAAIESARTRQRR